MTTHADAEQPALDGLAPRRRRRRTAAAHTPASDRPIARVVLDVQATHLGQTFDYLVDERDADAAQPGSLVRVRFGGRRVDGIVWERAAHSDVPSSALRYLERVVTAETLVPDSLRGDITAIADAYGGTRANIVRLAVPPRIASVESSQRLAASLGRRRTPDGLAVSVSQRGERLLGLYDGLDRLRDALADGGFSPWTADPLPGTGEAVRLLAWMAAAALAAGRSAVVVLPGLRDTEDLVAALGDYGLERFAPTGAAHGGWGGDVAVLGAGMPPADRYRAYLAVARGQVRCAVGPRAAMYAPVTGGGLFAVMDDVAYQQADGMMPYAQARGVLRLRARRHGGTFVALAAARSVLSQAEADGALPEIGVSGPARQLRPRPVAVRETMPWVRWLNRDELARLADPSIGARVPHTAVANVRRALEDGPVLFSIPVDGPQTFCCAGCLRQARCRRCAGPLALRPGEESPRCLWCGAAATGWTCPHCGGDRLRMVRVGAAGTIGELQRLFRGVRIVPSSPAQPGGVLHAVPDRPLIVVATPGAEPRLPEGSPGYRAVAVLDAWTSLYRTGLDALTDTLGEWMRAVSLCAPRGRGGQALLIGETDPAIARSLMLWDPTILARRELQDRAEAGLPPLVSAACVWGRRDAVRTALRAIGALDGDLASCPMPRGGDGPGVLGPVPIPAPRTDRESPLDGTADRVKAVVRVPPARRALLAGRLRTEVARHVAAREPGELRFQLDRKDLD